MGLASLFLRAEEGKLLPSAGCFLGNSGASKLVLRWAEKLLSSLTDAKAGGGSSQRHIDGIWWVVESGVPTMARWDLRSVELAHGAER